VSEELAVPRLQIRRLVPALRRVDKDGSILAVASRWASTRDFSNWIHFAFSTRSSNSSVASMIRAKKSFTHHSNEAIIWPNVALWDTVAVLGRNGAVAAGEPDVGEVRGGENKAP
jgi:hypothetical protein